MKKLGRYVIQKELGHGAMGTVYLGKDSVLNRLVALKTVKAQPGSTEADQITSQKRFIREAKAAALLNHPNIVTIFDLGRDEATGSDFIAMEFVQGKTLDQYLSEKGKLGYKEAAAIIRQVASGLDYAHGHGIVHRDIKPGNLFIKDDGTVKIMDFGIARLSTSTLTQTGAMVGTPAYMAPERIMGKKSDSRSDIFSLGVVFYELLTGKRPFDADSFVTVAYKILNEEVEPIDPANFPVPEKGLSILEKCLEKNPDHRYQKASDLVRELDEASSAGPLQPLKVPSPVLTSSSKLPEGPKGSKKSQIKAIWVLLEVLLVVAMGGAIYWYFRSYPPTPAVQSIHPASQVLPPVASAAATTELVMQSSAPASPQGKENPVNPASPSATVGKTVFQEKVDAAMERYRKLPEEGRRREVNQVINSRKLTERFKLAFLSRVASSDPSPSIRKLARTYRESR